MPYDNPKVTAHNSNKPLMPTLASNRQVRSPLTPRLAAQHQSPQPGSDSIATKRLSANTTAARTPLPSRDELSTPVKAFINHNVTPRSASRRSRVDSGQSTPDDANAGMPQAFSAVNANALGQHNLYGSSNLSQQSFSTNTTSGTGSSSRPRSIILGSAQNPSIGRPGIARSGTTSPTKEETSMFFHASEAKNQPINLGSRPALRKDTSFFYASGQASEQDSRKLSKSPPPSPPAPARGANRSPQFFHANGQTEAPMPPAIALPTLQNPPFVRDQFQSTASIAQSPLLRSPSPTKDNIHLSYRKGASQVMRPNSIIPQKDANEIRLMRRRSSASPGQPVNTHKKSASVSSIASASIDSGSRQTSLSIQANMQPARITANVSPAMRKVSPTLYSPPIITSPSIQEHGILSSPDASAPLSPTKAASATGNQLSELVVNARRDRKVMDLEISNSSLLAINKQLEKQLRSQKAELRRFRRLTRAGRLSMTATQADDITRSDNEEGDIDSEEDCTQNDSSYLSDEGSDDSEGSSSLSPTAQADREAKQIAKDEERLRLDLSKHRQLLLDSQKMNQSLRRCLGWTEELINEGKRALSYRVRVSDVKLGGRVLSRDEELDESFEEHYDHHEDAHTHAEEAEAFLEPQEAATQSAQDVDEVMGMMSPWMRLGTTKAAEDREILRPDANNEPSAASTRETTEVAVDGAGSNS